MQNATQAAREAELIRKAEVHLDSASQPALTPAERKELAELLETDSPEA